MRSHQQFRETLTSGSMLSTTSRRIAFKSHNLQTVTSTRTSLNSFCSQVALPRLWPDVYHVRPQNIVSQIANNKYYNDDIAAALNLDPTDDVILEKWMLFSNIVNNQQHGCYNFFYQASKIFANTHNVDWKQPKNGDEHSEDSFAVESTI